MNKNLSLQLLESQESLQFALQSAKMGTWEIDLKTDSVTCCKQMLKLWNFEIDDFPVERKLFQNKVHADDLPKMRAAIQLAVETDTIYEFEYRIHPEPNVTRWVMSRGRCNYIEGTKTPDRFSGIVFDITDQKLKELKLAELAKEREHFFMIAGHELRTPLTLLNLQHEVLASELRDNFPETAKNQKIQEILFKQQENLLRLSRIVENILDESQINQGHLKFNFEQVDLSQTLSQVLDRFQVSSKASGIDMVARIENNISGNCDKFRIEQVILNLLSNAIRYGKGSPITIRLQKKNGFAELSVSDKGPGIRPEDQKRIFGRFERVSDDNSIQGIGLGLFICDQIIKAHQGKIQIQSVPDQGAEFIISLPL